MSMNENPEVKRKLTRREAREELFKLVFEMDFQKDVSTEELFLNAVSDRELPANRYLKEGFAGICEHLSEIDGQIGTHSNGWKTERMTPVSLAVMRVGTYELLYCDDIPSNVTLNECVEIVKKYDDMKARSFVNGVLNAIKDTFEGEIGSGDAKDDSEEHPENNNDENK